MAKKNYHNSLMLNSSNKSATAWKIINGQVNKKKSHSIPSCLVDEAGLNINNYQDATQAFNEYFINSINDLTDKLSVSGQAESDIREKIFFLFPITPQEVRSILIKISNKHSAGYDEIPCSLLIKVADHITNCLAMLINFYLFKMVFFQYF